MTISRPKQDAYIQNREPVICPTLISVGTVAKMIGASTSTVWRRVSDNTLPQACRIGGMTRWSRSEIEAVIAAKLAERKGGIV